MKLQLAISRALFMGLIALVPDGFGQVGYLDPAGTFYPQGPGLGQDTAGFPPNDARRPPGMGMTDLANALVLESQQIQDNIQYELAGSDIGRQAAYRAMALNDASRTMLANLPSGDARVISATFRDVDRAFTALSQILADYGRDAPRSVNSLDRVQRLTFQIRNRLGFYQPGGPGRPVDQPPAFDSRSLADATARLQTDIDRASRMTNRSFGQEFATAKNALSNMEGLNRFLQGLLTTSVRNEELWQACQQLRLASWDLFDFASRNQIDPQLRQQIVTLKGSHDIVCRLIGSDPNGPVYEPGKPPGQGRVVKPPPPDPAIPALRPVLRPNLPLRPASNPISPDFLALLNDTTNQSDAFLNTIETHVNQINFGHQFQAAARLVRSDLLLLNQQVRQAADRAELARAAQGLQQKTDQLAAMVQRVTNNRPGPIVNQFRSLQLSIGQIVQSLR